MIADPWSHAPPSGGAHRVARLRVVGLAVGGWLLGTWGPVLRVIGYGPTQARAAMVLAVLALALAIALVVVPSWLARAGAAVVAGGAGVVLCRAALGVTPVAVALAGVVVAVAALCGWSWLDQGVPASLRGRSRTGEPQVLAVPLIAAAGAAWHRSGSLPVFALVLGLALVVVAAHRLWPVALGRGDAWVVRATTALASAVASVVVGLVAVPLLWIPGAVAEAVARVRRRRRARSSSWTLRQAPLDEQRRDSANPFATAEVASRRVQTAVGLLVAVALVAGTAAWIRHGDPVVVNQAVPPAGIPADPPAKAEQTSGSPTRQVPLSERPATKGLAYGPELLDEQIRVPLPPGPVAGYGVGDFSSRYTNVADGKRRTIPAPDCSCEPVRVWFTGGSAGFGQGQRDDHTIASELVREADRAGTSLAVSNIAVPGYTLWQEYQSVVARLARGGPKPQAVIFYDGFNDLTYSVAQVVVTGPSWDQPVTYDPQEVLSFRSTSDAKVRRELEAAGGIDVVARRAAKRFSDLQRLVEQQLAAVGVEAHFYFQADALDDPLQRQGGRTGDPSLNAFHLAMARKALVAGAAARPPGAIDLRPTFDGYPRAVFLDLVHSNEEGASVIAKAIEQGSRTRFRKLAGDDGGG